MRKKNQRFSSKTIIIYLKVSSVKQPQLSVFAAGILCGFSGGEGEQGLIPVSTVGEA